jgi:hypothetical protein
MHQILLMLLTGSRAAEAQFYSGNDLHGYCSVDRGNLHYAQYMGICQGFVAGVVDSSLRPLSFRVCVPAGVTLQQTADVVTNYLRDHPEERHYTAQSLVVFALQQAWPCG